MREGRQHQRHRSSQLCRKPLAGRPGSPDPDLPIYSNRHFTSNLYNHDCIHVDLQLHDCKINASVQNSSLSTVTFGVVLNGGNLINLSLFINNILIILVLTC